MAEGALMTALRAYEEGFTSIRNVVERAAPEKKLTAFQVISSEVPKWVRDGGVAKAEAVDRLADILNVNGVPDDEAQDAIAGIFAEADAKGRREAIQSYILDDDGQAGQSNGHYRTTVELWPEPLAADAFHGIAGELVRAIEPTTEADPVAILLQFLAAFGNACGRGCYYQVEGDRHPPVIWPVLVGRTSKGRKGTSWGRVREVIAQVDPHWAADRIVSGLSTGEGIVYAVRDAVVDESGETTDHGVSDKRLLVLEPEFASPLRHIERAGNILSSTLRALWDNGCSASLTKNSPVKTTGATVTIIGHVTDDELRRYLTKTERANGLANRFLFALVRRSKVLPFGGTLLDFGPFQARLKEAIARAWADQRIGWTKEGADLWASVYSELSEGKPGLAGAVTSRAETQVVRIALTYALLDGDPAIAAAHLKAALAIWRYCEESARIIFQSMTGNHVADEIMLMLKKSPAGMSRYEISNAFHRHQPSEAISTALHDLVHSGLVWAETRNTGGRPEERWYAKKAK
jgi:hypothetical protein